MHDEVILVSEFAASRSENAFAGIVKMHLNLVFSTALRQLGDRGMAEEVTQNVFLALAEKAGSLRWDTTLAGWLYRTTLNQARQRLRSELRRQRREDIAAGLSAMFAEGESTWAGLAPLLDEALVSLREKDRLAVILHFMEERPLREVGQVLGVGEDAARKRVNRVVEDLMDWFRRRGFAISAGTMIASLSLRGVEAVPAGISASIALACSSVPVAGGTTASILGFLGFMASTQTKLAVTGILLLAGLTTPFVWRNRDARALAGETNSVAGQAPARTAETNAKTIASRGPLTFPEGTTPGAPPEKNIFERINEGDNSLSMLPADQADAFIAQNRTNAQSLLAGFRVTHDMDYLRRAATNFPNDPAVLFRVVAHDAFPENRRAWLDQFKKADPGNSLADYLSAKEHFEKNNVEAALADLSAAGLKPAFADHVTEHIQTLEEIYLAAGRSPAEAKAIGMSAVELPHVAQLVEMSKNMLDLVRQYQGANDSTSAESMTRMGLKLADNLRGGVQEGGNLLGEMVSVVVQQRFLGQLDPAATYDFAGGSVEERRAALSRREQEIRTDSQLVGRWISAAPESEILSYFDRLKLYGETAALTWLKNRNAAQ